MSLTPLPFAKERFVLRSDGLITSGSYYPTRPTKDRGLELYYDACRVKRYDPITKHYSGDWVMGEINQFAYVVLSDGRHLNQYYIKLPSSSPIPSGWFIPFAGEIIPCFQPGPPVDTASLNMMFMDMQNALTPLKTRFISNGRLIEDEVWYKAIQFFVNGSTTFVRITQGLARGLVYPTTRLRMDQDSSVRQLKSSGRYVYDHSIKVEKIIISEDPAPAARR